METRNCFFGSQQAADNALREAAKQAECFTDNKEPPGCVCPPALPAGTELCQSWAVNLVRLYAYRPAEAGAFVHDLSSRLADRCRTSGGVLLAPGAEAGIAVQLPVPPRRALLFTDHERPAAARASTRRSSSPTCPPAASPTATNCVHRSGTSCWISIACDQPVALLPSLQQPPRSW